jgi:hypothetical protein
MHVQDTSHCTAAALYYKRKISCIIWARRHFINTQLSLFVNLWKCKLRCVKEDLGSWRLAVTFFSVWRHLFSHNVENMTSLLPINVSMTKSCMGSQIWVKWLSCIICAKIGKCEWESCHDEICYVLSILGWITVTFS